jgi:hypothetical protein
MPPKRSYGPDDVCIRGHKGDWYTYPNGSYTICRKCRRERSLKWQRENPDKYREQQQKTYKKNIDKRREYEKKRARDPERKRYNKNKNLLDKYGITIEEFECMVESQNGLCAICEERLTYGRNGCAVDHDHTTGQVRSILCSPCNKGIGHFQENISRIKAAVMYLETWNQTEGEEEWN